VSGIRFLSVCSGIEAASVAWAPLGWRAAAFSEIEHFPCSLLAHHYPSVPNLGDMTQFQEWPDLGSIDLLCGGTPCQSFSVSGLRKGLADPRGNLMLTFGAIAAKHRPRWMVWENVPGVLSSDGGRDFGSFLGLLGELGYGFAYRVLDAQYTGLAQRRKRVFVIGCLGSWQRAAAVLFERHSLSGHPAPSREARQGIAVGALAGTSPCGGWRAGADEAGAGQLVAFGGNNTSRPIDVAAGLNAHGGRTRTGAGFDASEDGTGRGTPLIAFDTTQITSKANRSSPKAGDPCHPLAAGAHAPAVAFDARQSDVIQYGEKTGPLDTDGYTIGVHSGMQVRRLTPRECERLQGFPDDYTAIPHRGKPAADGPRYKAIGNSWAVPVAAWVGRRIASVDSLELRAAA